VTAGAVFLVVGAIALSALGTVIAFSVDAGALLSLALASPGLLVLALASRVESSATSRRFGSGPIVPAVGLATGVIIGALDVSWGAANAAVTALVTVAGIALLARRASRGPAALE